MPEAERGSFDIDKVSMGEIEEIEEYAGEPWAKILESMVSGAMSGRAMTAMLWIHNRRTDSTFTVEQARQLPFSEVTAIFPDASGEEADPKAENAPATGG